MFHDRTNPEIALEPLTAFVSPSLPLRVRAADAQSGIRRMSIAVTSGNQTYTILDKRYEGAPRSVEEPFTLEAFKLPDGDVTIDVAVSDASFAGFGQGNVERISRKHLMDTIKPTVSVQSTQHYVRQGGPGLVVYTVNEPPARSGVQVGDRFFPGYEQGNGKFACFFAFPHDMDAKDFHPVLFAEDAAGNRAVGAFSLNAIPRTFRRDTINVSDNLINKIDSEFASQVPGQYSALERYVRANREVRAANEKVLQEIGLKTTALPLWSGAFRRMPGAPMARFADHRTYIYNGQEVDQQTHMGQDIASTANAPVPAGNHGVVVFAGYLGIYGYMIMLDHGMGLQSMYAHLSEMHVKEGDRVTKGQVLGKTGFTGMALGDHLHFGMYVSGVPVSPIEWWDSSWIKNNITDRLILPAAVDAAKEEAEDAAANAAAEKGAQPAKKPAPKNKEGQSKKKQ
ncbi:M23 family metallopeptidase [Megalodesulfovibrio paquesii]